MEGIRFGTSSSKSWKFAADDQADLIDGEVYTIFDTASSDMHISALWFDDLVYQIMNEVGIDDYEVTEGEVFSRCDVDFPDLNFIMGGYDLTVNADDYVQDITTDGSRTNCRLRLVSLNAPFHIAGGPLYNSYAVGHITEKYDGEEPARMTFKAAVGSSTKDIPEQRAAPKNELQVGLAVENMENGKFWAWFISLCIVLTLFGVYALVAYAAFYETEGIGVTAIVMAGGLLASAILFWILRWIFRLIFLPGDEVIDVPEGNDAAPQVGATHIAFFGIISFAAYKLFSKKEEAPKKQETATVESQIDELVNTIA